MMEVTGFHFVGDMAHLAAIVLLPIKLQWSSASGSCYPSGFVIVVGVVVTGSVVVYLRVTVAVCGKG